MLRIQSDFGGKEADVVPCNQSDISSVMPKDERERGEIREQGQHAWASPSLRFVFNLYKMVFSCK